MTQIIIKKLDVESPTLIKKLYYQSTRGISNKWFKSDLAEHQRFIFSNNSESSRLKAPRGIPQRSTVGLLLF